MRDALIVFGVTLTSSLIAYGYPPRAEALYMSFLASLQAFFVSLAYSYGVKGVKHGRGEAKEV